MPLTLIWMTERPLSLFLPSLVGGGAERVFVQLANEFRQRGHRVDMVLASAHGPYLRELDAEVRVVDLRSPSVLRALMRLVGYLRAERPFVLMSALDHANVVAVIANLISLRVTRCIVSSRSIPTVWYQRATSIRNRIVLQMMRITYRFADAIVVNSTAGARDLERLLRLRGDRMAVIYNPVDVHAIAELSAKMDPHPWCEPAPFPTILGVGRLDPLKDFATLIRAFARVRAQMRCRLVILGEGTERTTLEQLVSALEVGEDVCLPGFLDNPFPWIRSADVVVSASLSEGCPNAILQALACGTPVVSTDGIGGSAELLEDGRWGRLVPVGDDVAMADAIVATLSAAENPDGKLRARDFSPERIVDQYLEVLLPHDWRMEAGR